MNRHRLPDTREACTKKIAIQHGKPLGASTAEALLVIKDLYLATVEADVPAAVRSQAIQRAQAVLAKHERDQLVTTKFYVTAGLYADGTVGEIFLKGDRVGSAISGLLDALAMCISVGLQAGVPLSWYTGKLKNMRFEPAGATGDATMPRVTSLVDALARWLEMRFPVKEGE